ncbi:MAG: glycosyltransferase family 4 protein [Desulfuromonadales bacterium]
MNNRLEDPLSSAVPVAEQPIQNEDIDLSVGHGVLQPRLHILHLIKRYQRNHFLMNEFARLDPDHFRVTICYLCGEDDGRNGIEEIAARTYYLKKRSSDLRIFNFSLISQVARLIDQEDIHIVNCHLRQVAPLGLVAARAAANRPALISTAHGLGTARRFGYKMQHLFVYPMFQRIVGVSEAVRSDVLHANWNMKPEKVAAIPNGLNLARFLAERSVGPRRRSAFPQIQADFVFGTVGRLVEVKNQRRLLHAFRRIVDALPSCALVLAGQGELESQLRALTRSLDLQEHVWFLGQRKDIPEVLSGLDAFVFPSLREGLGMALVEAMASGLPVIGARVGGIPEVFGDADIGALIDPLDVEALAEAMMRLARLPEAERRRLGENARARAVDHFSAGLMIRRWEQLYQEVAHLAGKP